MNPIRAATLCVADLEAAARRYADFLDYREIERGWVDAALAQSWGAPACADRPQRVLGPASGAASYLRLIEAPADPGFKPLRTHGWAALEICVEDVLAVHQRLLGGPFEIIGPPQPVSALPAIHPMQVQGPDGEVVYLTQIKQGGPGSGLPTPRSPIDSLFIVVAACADLGLSAAWVAQQLDVPIAPEINMPYRMLARAFGLPPAQLHRLTTASFQGEIFLELDQYPEAATPRSCAPGDLPPGIGLCSFAWPALDTVPGPWLAPPAPRLGAVYQGRRAGTLCGPDGLLLELVETRP
jgi:hypothetical protein